MRKFTSFLLSMILAILALPIQAAVSPSVVIDKEYTDLASLGDGVPFAIVNKETGKALYGSTNQNLAYDVLSAAYSASNTGYYFKLDAPAEDADDESIAACHLLRLLTPAGAEYNIWGSPGYINSQPATGSCSFILGLNDKNGQDIKNGAVWDIQYVEGKGFTLLNKGTGKYLNDAAPAKYDEPVYWTFCTLKTDYSTAFTSLFEEEAKMKSNGTSDEANAVYDAAVADIKAAIEAGTLENTEQAVATVNEALNVLAKAQTAAGSDFTRAIVNPTIDGAAGWTCERPNGGNGPLLGGSSFEYWAGNANPRTESKFDYYQVVAGIPNGIYTVSAEMYNSLNNEAGATFAPTCGLYAQDKVQLVDVDGTTLTEYVLNDVEVTDGTLRLGVKSVESLAARWFVADNFHLTLNKTIEVDPKPEPDPDPEASLIKNASFEADGEKAASNGPLSLTGWTFEGVGNQYNNTEIRPAGSASSTSAYGTSDPSDGSYSLFFRQGWNGNGNVITLTSDAVAELPAGSYKLSVDYKSYYGYDNTTTQNTTVGIALKNGEVTLASEVSAPAEGGNNSTYFNDAPWSTLTATFSLENTLDAGSQVVITLNAGGQKRSDFFIDNVQLVKVSESEIAIENLNKVITSAQTIVDAKANVGDGLFQIPTEAYETLSKEVAAAKAVADKEDATAEDLKAAQEALEGAVAAYKATPATAPAADEQYVLSLVTSAENSPVELSFASGKVSIEEKGTPVTFVAMENGTYALSNGTEYVVYKGGNNWDMSTSTEAGFGWTIAAVEGGYTLTGNNGRFLGTNKDAIAAGSTCYGDKKADNGNYIWTIDEYVAPEPALAAIADDATVTLPEGELEADEDGFVKATLTGKITVDESIASDAQAFLMYTLTEKTEEAGGEDEPVQAIKGGVDISADEEEGESAELQFDVESQEVLLPVEAGKKYTLTVKSIVVNYYDEDVEDMVTAAEKTFEGDNAIVIDFATKAAEEPEDPATYVEIAQTVDDATGATLATKVENDGFTEYTFDGGICVAFKMLNVNVKDYDRVVIKFAEPVPAGLKASFVEGQGNEDITEGSTEWVNDLSKNTAVKDGILPQITLLTIFAQAGKVAKVEGVYLVKDSKPELATIKSFEISKWPGEAFNNENMTYTVVATCSADVDESVEEPVVKVKGILKSGEESKEIISNDIPFTDIAESVSAEIALPVEYGKSYTFDVTSVGIYSVSEEEGAEPALLAEKTYAEGENSVSFDIPEAPKPELATIADDITVTLPEGELEADEDGFVKATLTGKITVDESIASDAQAFLVYTLTEQTEEAGGEDEPVQAIKGGVDISADEEEGEYAELQFDQESQEVLLPVEAGKKYTLTVKSIVVNYYDEDVENMVTAAEKKFEGDNAIVVDFATKEEAPVLAELAIVTLKAADDAVIDEEDGTFPVTFGYGLNVHESIAAMASGMVYYTVQAKGSEETIKGSTDFDVAKEERTIYVPGLDYSTEYVIGVDSVIISYFDAETFEEKVAGKFTEPTAYATFTTNAKPEPVPEFDIAEEFTSLESLKGAVFAIVNKETGKALYGPDNQNLGYDVAEVAFAETNAGFYFKVDTLSKGTDEEAYALRMLTPEGEEYNIWGSPGYLNSQPAETGWCSFILGLNNQNGQDLKDGAAWDIQYVEGKGFTLLNKGTGKYLTSNDAAKSDEPVYWTFCTINGTKIADGIDGINAAKAADGKYIENGKVVIVRNGKKISVAGFGIK